MSMYASQRCESLTLRGKMVQEAVKQFSRYIAAFPAVVYSLSVNCPLVRIGTFRLASISKFQDKKVQHLLTQAQSPFKSSSAVFPSDSSGKLP